MQNIRIKLEVEQWNNACKYLKDPSAGLDVAEESAIEQLSDFWRTQAFSKDLSNDCAELLESLKKNLKLYSSNNRKTKEQLQDYISIAKRIYCSDKATYDAYVEALRTLHNVRKTPTPKPPTQSQNKTPVAPTPPEKSVLNIISVDFSDSNGDQDKYGLVLPTTVHYIQPRVRYSINPAPKNPIKLSYRIFSPAGEMKKNDSHPDGILNTQVLTSREGTIFFDGWGNDDGTSYYEGRWRFELYSDSELIKTTYFEIKSPFSHIPPSIDIQKVEFANIDYDGGIINDFGTELPQNTKYLTPRIFYTVRNKENRQIELRYMIYGPDGLPIKNSARSDRYISSTQLNLALDSPFRLNGFGNRDGNSYLAGRYKVEIYESDYLLHTTYVNIGRTMIPPYNPPITSPTKTKDPYSSRGGCFMTLLLTAVVIAVIFGVMKWCSRDNSEAENLTSTTTCLVTGNAVNLRQGPGTQYDKFGMVVSSGETYKVLEESGDWVKIDYNGTEAWLSSKYCNIISRSPQDEDMIDEDQAGRNSKDVKNPVDRSERNIERKSENNANEYEQLSVESETTETPVEHEYPIVTEAASSASPAPQNTTQDDNVIHISVEQQAEYPGGMPALMKWLSANVRYPESAQQKDVQGRVVVKFVVEKDGSITNAQVIKSVDKDLDKEALRVVSLMPKWNPGKNGGIPVRVYYTIPVSFRLQKQ